MKRAASISPLPLLIVSLLLARYRFALATNTKPLPPNPNSNPHETIASPFFLTEVNPKAKCLDGSSGVIYVSPSPTPNNNNWVIGSRWGGWCSLDVPINLTALGQDVEHTVDHCYSRSLYYKGSTANLTSSNTSSISSLASGAMYVSRDPNVNPVMHDWNFAWLLYCDGTSLSGRLEEPIIVDGPLGEKSIYFAGSYIRDAAYTLLRDRFGLGSDSVNSDGDSNGNNNVVITGQSAGGLATILHINWWGKQLGEMYNIIGVTDGGYFLDYDTSNTTNDHDYFVESYHDQMRYLYDRAKLDVNQDCVGRFKKDNHVRGRSNSSLGPQACMFAQHSWPFLRHPIFVLNSRYDDWQLNQMLGYTSVQHSDRINAYGSRLSNEIIKSVNTGYGKNLRHGAFIDSCQHHTIKKELQIDGVSVMTALSSWIDAHIHNKDWENVKQLFVDKRKWPCKECCQPELIESPAGMAVLEMD